MTEKADSFLLTMIIVLGWTVCVAGVAYQIGFTKGRKVQAELHQQTLTNIDSRLHALEDGECGL